MENEGAVKRRSRVWLSSHQTRVKNFSTIKLAVKVAYIETVFYIELLQMRINTGMEAWPGG